MGAITSTLDEVADSPGDGAQFVVRPNNSLSWRGNKRFFVGMCAVSLGVAGTLAARGAWLVLPFAGLEMLVLWGVLYHCARHACRREVITIVGDTVRVAVGREHVERSCTLERYWARVILDRADTNAHNTRLLLRARGRQVEVGVWLVDHERRALAARLRKVL